jgi:hypothetical protein
MKKQTWTPMSCKRVDGSGYFLWSREAGRGLIYQLTIEPTAPPDDMGGHYKLDKLLALKGL